MHPLHISQVALVVRNIEETLKHLNSLWHIGPVQLREMDVPDAVVHGKRTRVKAKLAFFQAGPIEVELIEPGEGENIFREFLNRKGEGLHHVAIRVPDIKSEVARLEGGGIHVLQSGETPRVSFAYMDAEGVGAIVELLQARKEASFNGKGDDARIVIQ
jgi:hypothetical protein